MQDHGSIINILQSAKQRATACKPTISAFASNILETEVQGLFEKGAIFMVGYVQKQYLNSYFAVPKSKRSPEMETNPEPQKVH